MGIPYESLNLRFTPVVKPEDGAEKAGGDGLRLISYDGGTGMRSKSAIAAITPPMFSAALADSVNITDTFNDICKV
jgi:hypothetical protein